MEWNRSDTLALAAHSCTRCHGVGLLYSRRIGTSPCHCVLRNIFRACHVRFRQCVEKEKYLCKVTLNHCSSPNSRPAWGRKDEEYIADFTLVSRRYLDEAEYRIFRFHFLLGADWKLCCRRLNTDRGTFFHDVYRIQEKLGRVFRELEPFSLYPVDEYFNAARRMDVTSLRSVNPIPIRSTGPRPVVPTLRAA